MRKTLPRIEKGHFGAAIRGCGVTTPLFEYFI
jgi:hypothetical protein